MRPQYFAAVHHAMAVRFGGVLKGSLVDFFLAGGSGMPQMYSNVAEGIVWVVEGWRELYERSTRGRFPSSRNCDCSFDEILTNSEDHYARRRNH